MKISRLLAAAVASLTIAAVGCSSGSDDSTSGTTDDHLGESAAPLARFAPYMTSLKSSFAGADNEAIANSLLASGRPAAFSLQALGRVYSDADPKFKTFRDDFKGLEDGIGNYDKWATIYNTAVSEHKDQATLDRLKAQKDDALTAFTKLLTDKKWLAPAGEQSLLDQWQVFLNGFAWLPRNEDRKLVLKQMSKELGDIHDTAYDMKILEVGNGIHELRRDIRWVLIEELGLNGMVLAKEGACPIPAYSATQSDGRYGALHASQLEPNPCQVDACLIYQAAKTVNDLGELKDQAEQEVNINGDADVVPERLQPAAQAIYDGIKQNDLIGKYQAQLKACRDAL